jgi:hypothetical protein
LLPQTEPARMPKADAIAGSTTTEGRRREANPALSVA